MCSKSCRKCVYKKDADLERQPRLKLSLWQLLLCRGILGWEFRIYNLSQNQNVFRRLRGSVIDSLYNVQQL